MFYSIKIVDQMCVFVFDFFYITRYHVFVDEGSDGTKGNRVIVMLYYYEKLCVCRDESIFYLGGLFTQIN